MSRAMGRALMVPGKQMRLKHGDKLRGKPAPEYEAWTGMIGRCHNEKDQRFSYYGGRGITVCARWRGDGKVEGLTRHGQARPGHPRLTLPPRRGCP